MSKALRRVTWIYVIELHIIHIVHCYIIYQLHEIYILYIYQLHERSEYQLQGHNNDTNLNSLV